MSNYIFTLHAQNGWEDPTTEYVLDLLQAVLGRVVEVSIGSKKGSL